jgi:sodium/bile acid cotransporter 7
VRIRHAGKLLSPVLLVCLFYFIFCKAFAARAHGLSLAAVAKLVSWTTVVFAANLGLAALVAWRFGPKRFVSFLICAPQKTESLGVALVTVIFAHEEAAIGELTFPIVCYHSIELVIGALLLPYLTRVAARDPQREPIVPASQLREPLTDAASETVEEGRASVEGAGSHS